MPFYEYECDNCKFYIELLQKVSDAPLRKCPSCGKNAMKKLISAPVFRLKGAGWYETDFKTDKEGKRNLAIDKEPDTVTESKPAAKASDAKAADSKPADSKPADAKPAQAKASESSKSSETGSSEGSSSGRRSSRRSAPASKPSAAAKSRAKPAPKAKKKASPARRKSR